MAHLSRRTLIASAAALLAKPALAAASPPLMAGALAGNPVARLFQAPPVGATLPDVALDGEHGPKRLSAYRGKTLLVPLWAEWCADCLVEMGDLAALQKRFGGARFEIVPVLTASKSGLDAGRAAFLLNKVGGGELSGAIEPKRGTDLAKAFCQDPTNTGRFNLPCILLVDPRGRVVGRHIGLVLAPGSDPHAGKSIWSTPPAAAFCAALAGGALRTS
jgi:thiol-disulfide isomerase/thioredoxin